MESGKAIVIAVVALLVVSSVMFVALSTFRASAPPDSHRDLNESVPGPTTVQPSTKDRSAALGSEGARVVVVAFIPVEQDCVAGTVKALRQLVAMYPEELFVALRDLEAMEAGGQPHRNITFRGIDPANASELRKILGLPAMETDGQKDASESGDHLTMENLLDVMDAQEKDSSADTDDTTGIASYCASITINGEMSYNEPAADGKEARAVIFSGPHGNLYTAADLKAAVEAHLRKQYGDLPERRAQWADIPVDTVLSTPKPLYPGRRETGSAE